MLVYQSSADKACLFLIKIRNSEVSLIVGSAGNERLIHSQALWLWALSGLPLSFSKMMDSGHTNYNLTFSFGALRGGLLYSLPEISQARNHM